MQGWILEFGCPRQTLRKGPIFYTRYTKALFIESKFNFFDFLWEFVSAWRSISHYKLFEVIWFSIVLCLHIRLVEGPLLAYLHRTFVLIWQTCDLLQSLLNVPLDSRAGVPKLGYIYLLEGVHLTLAIEGKNVYILFISNHLCIYQWIQWASK